MPSNAVESQELSQRYIPETFVENRRVNSARFNRSITGSWALSGRTTVQGQSPVDPESDLPENQTPILAHPPSAGLTRLN